MIGHSRPIILKHESTSCRNAADELRFTMKVNTLCQGAADQLRFLVKVLSSWKNGSATQCMLWNGRRILVWNMEEAQNGTKVRLPYLPNFESHIVKLITNHELNVMHLPIRKKRQQDYLCKLQYLA